jgi:predicted acyl esterase
MDPMQQPCRARDAVGRAKEHSSQLPVLRFSQLTTGWSPESSKMPNKIQDLHTVDKDSFPYIYEQNATVELKTSDGLVRVNVFRPKTDEKVPVLCTYGPYGKDIPYAE